MSLPRFFAPSLDPSATETTLPADESHHLVRVMRLGTGDEVAVFDGRGHEMLARVERTTPKAVTVTLVRPLPAPPPPRVPIVLVQAVLKGDKMDGVVRDATMAGVSSIVPVVTERSLVSLATLTRGHAVDRWHRVAISSAKQCGRAHLPHIHPPCNFCDWLNAPFDGHRLLLVEPAIEIEKGGWHLSEKGGWHLSEKGASHLLSPDSETGPPETETGLPEKGGWHLFQKGASHLFSGVACVVGPEGGWADGEHRAAIDAGCEPVTLGSMTLRADAAGLVAVSIVSFLLEQP